MPTPEWLFRYEVNPAALPLHPDDAEGIARTLDELLTMLGEIALEYRKGEHRDTTRVEL